MSEPVPVIDERSLPGTLIAFLSATCFGTLAILVKYAYGEGVGTLQLIATRFLIAAAGLWLLALLTGQRPWRIGRRPLFLLLVMGSTLYSLQAFSYIYAVRALPASLVSLLLYSYPALVAIGARTVFGRRLSRGHIAALAGSFAGVLLLVGGVPKLTLSPSLLIAGIAPIVYTLYILAADLAMRGISAIAAATVVMSAAAVTFTLVAAVGGELRPPPNLRAGALLATIGLVPTIAAITLFLAAVPRIGAGRVSLLSTWEPLFTVILAVLLLGERLAPLQLAGAAILILAVVALQSGRGLSSPLRTAPGDRSTLPPSAAVRPASRRRPSPSPRSAGRPRR